MRRIASRSLKGLYGLGLLVCKFRRQTDLKGRCISEVTIYVVRSNEFLDVLEDVSFVFEDLFSLL